MLIKFDFNENCPGFVWTVIIMKCVGRKQRTNSVINLIFCWRLAALDFRLCRIQVEPFGFQRFALFLQTANATSILASWPSYIIPIINSRQPQLQNLNPFFERWWSESYLDDLHVTVEEAFKRLEKVVRRRLIHVLLGLTQLLLRLSGLDQGAAWRVEIC